MSSHPHRSAAWSVGPVVFLVEGLAVALGSMVARSAIIAVENLMSTTGDQLVGLAAAEDQHQLVLVDSNLVEGLVGVSVSVVYQLLMVANAMAALDFAISMAAVKAQPARLWSSSRQHCQCLLELVSAAVEPTHPILRTSA